MTIDDLYALINEVELEQKYLFIVYEPGIGIDVLDYDTEDYIDGAWFNTYDEAIEYVKEHEGSL